MRVLVTGGAGYIGSHVVLACLLAGHEVTVIDDLSTGHRGALKAVARLAGRSPRFIHADVAAEAAGVISGHDAVIHFAAKKRVDESMVRPDLYFSKNTGCMAQLIHAMAESGVTRIVYSSSAAVYGTQAVVPVAESATLLPESPYGLSKRQGEEMLDWMAVRRGWSAVSLRYFNPVGAHESGDLGQCLDGEAALLPRVMRALLFDDAPISVFGTDWPTPDGSCQRDFVHIADLARAHLVALDALARPGHHAYNVGTGRPHSVLEVLATCAEVAGRPVPHRIAGRREGDFPVSVADARRFRDECGFIASRGLHDMVSSAWRWASRHPRGFA